MLGKLFINYINTAEKIFYVGFGVKIPYCNNSTFKIPYSNNSTLSYFNHCVLNGLLFSLYPITGPYYLYKLYKN